MIAGEGPIGLVCGGGTRHKYGHPFRGLARTFTAFTGRVGTLPFNDKGADKACC